MKITGILLIIANLNNISKCLASENAEDNTLYCALIGTGRQSNRLAEAIEVNGAVVTKIFSRKIETGQTFAGAHNISLDTVTTSLEDILNDSKVKAVVIATPDVLHYEQAKLALEAGKHVFLEKPIATNEAHAQKLIQLAKDKGLVLAIDYHMRCSSALRALKKLVAEQHFGNIQHVKIHWGFKAYRVDGWRNQDNPWWVLSMLGTHCIDQVLWIFEPAFGKVQDFKGIKFNKSYSKTNADHTEMTFKFENGSVVEVECDLTNQQDLSYIIDSDIGQFKFDKLLGQGQEIKTHRVEEKFDYVNPWHASFENFLEAINGAKDYEVGLEAALQNLKYLRQIKMI